MAKEYPSENDKDTVSAAYADIIISVNKNTWGFLQNIQCGTAS